MGARPSLLFPDVRQYLLVDEGEQVVDEVVKHPVCMLFPGFLAIAGVLTMLAAPVAGRWWYVIVAVGSLIGFTGLWKFHAYSMDRFVVTNMRVFRVTGVINRHVATMPLTRILDISLYQPFFGMVFNYGHFTFESAAADQGLRRVTYVSDPKRRDLTIQRVIQRAGIRAMALAKEMGDGAS